MEQFVIQSNSSGIAQLEQFISHLCDEKHVLNHQAIIWIAVEAAVDNAIVHGNQGDASKFVVIESGDCEGGVYFSISDQGAGFNPSTTEEGGGMGLSLMRMLADKVLFNSTGNMVRLEFYIRGIDRELALERFALLKQYYSLKTIEA